MQSDCASYLSEALKGGYAYDSEDRLTQVFTASFNHSAAFRKCFFRLLGIKAPPDLHAVTQTHVHGANSHSNDARLDICLYHGNRCWLVIENKVDAPLYLKQLGHYAHLPGFKNVKKVALVKHFFEFFSDRKGWSIHHWGDFYRILSRNVSEHDEGTVDHFVTANIMSYMEECGMNTVTKISHQDLVHLAVAIHKIRKAKGIWFSLKHPAFETANNYLTMLEQIVEMSRQEPIIQKAVRKNYQFNPSINEWCLDVKAKRYDVMLCVTISLRSKGHRVNRVTTGILFFDDKPGRYEVLTFWQNQKNSSFRSETEYRGKGIDFDRYSRQVISLWKKWLKKRK